MDHGPGPFFSDKFIVFRSIMDHIENLLCNEEKLWQLSANYLPEAKSQRWYCIARIK